MICVAADCDHISQPDNSHNPNNKAIETLVGLRKNNRCEHPPQIQNYAIEQYFENKSYLSVWEDLKTVF